MSTASDPEPSVDIILPEDSVDIKKLSKLDDLSKVAQANTTQVRKLQRQLFSSREDPNKQHLIEPLEEAIAKRQQRGIRMVRHREALQQQESIKKRNILEEALRPTVGALNNDRRALIEQVTDMYDRIKAMNGKYVEHTLEQRRLAARLKQWENFLLTMTYGLDRLPPLPVDLE
jgi:hypothetical protein